MLKAPQPAPSSRQKALLVKKESKDEILSRVSDIINKGIEEIVEAGMLKAVVEMSYKDYSDATRYRKEIDEFYAAFGYSLAWDLSPQGGPSVIIGF
jgi:hypothetical protein